MKYTLQSLLPAPLKDRNTTHTSQIWETDTVFEKGKHYLILAPSGKGKSTFLHILYGLRQDYKGRVSINDKVLKTFTPEELSDLRKNQLSIVFQDLRLFPDLSALDNILLKASLTSTYDTSQIEQMAARLGIADLLGQSCGTLSYGQQQRVAIIRALVQPFDFLLLDEPFSHLDEENQKNALELIIERCQQQQAAMLLVSLGEQFEGVFDAEMIL